EVAALEHHRRAGQSGRGSHRFDDGIALADNLQYLTVADALRGLHGDGPGFGFGRYLDLNARVVPVARFGGCVRVADVHLAGFRAEVLPEDGDGVRGAGRKHGERGDLRYLAADDREVRRWTDRIIGGGDDQVAC